MIEKILLNYKEKIKKEQEQPFLNEIVDKNIDLLKTSESFKEIKENDIKDLLIKINYNDLEIEKVLMTLKYAKLNNSYLEYKDLFEDIFNKFLSLKKPFRDLSELNILLEHTNHLLEIINSQELAFKQDNLTFFLKLVEEEKLDMEFIIESIKEIDKHNNLVYEYKKRLIEEDDEIDLKTELDKEIVDLNEFLKSHMNILTDNEKEILRILYLDNKDIINKNLTYVLNSSEFAFIKDDFVKYGYLFITLIGYSSVDIMKSIVSLCNDYNISLQELLPTYFVSKDHENKFKDTDYEFYNTLDGSYEHFIDILKRFEGIINANKLIKEFSSLLITDYNIVKDNIEILKSYNIPLSDASIKALSDPNLLFKIDRFIEVGLYEYIKNAPTILLTKDEALFHRIYYAKKNNIQIKKRFLFKDITDLNGLGINSFNYQDKVEVYKPSSITIPFYQKILENKNIVVSTTDPIFNILKDMEIDEVTYQIKGTNISKNKVIRLYENYKQSILNIPRYSSSNDSLIAIRGIIFAILSDVILDKEETVNIIKEILNKFKEHLTSEEMSLLKSEFKIEDSLEMLSL